MKEPNGKLLNAFLMIVWDKKIGEVIPNLCGRDIDYSEITFGCLEKSNTSESFWLFFPGCRDQLCRVNISEGILTRFYSQKDFDYIQYIRDHSIEETL